MVPVLVDATRPAGATKLSVHCGDPVNDTVFDFAGVVQARVWEDGTLAGIDSAGAFIVLIQPHHWWGYLWI